jgi:hypothetical protein
MAQMIVFVRMLFPFILSVAVLSSTALAQANLTEILLSYPACAVSAQHFYWRIILQIKCAPVKMLCEVSPWRELRAHGFAQLYVHQRYSAI